MQAAYDYYKICTTSKHNIEFALEGYHRAVADIIAEDSEIFAARQDGLLQISDKRIFIEKGQTRLKAYKKASRVQLISCAHLCWKKNHTLCCQ